MTDCREYTGSPDQWNALVASEAGGTFCHWHGWKTVIERVFGHECRYLGAYEGDRLAGVLPLVRVRSRIFGHYLVSMPFLNYGGPLGSREAIRGLADRAVALAEEGRAKLLELRSVQELPVDLPVSHRKITVLMDLPRDPGALWDGIPAKVRSQVRRPQKEGVTVSFGLDQLDPFYLVFAQHMRDLGTPVQSRRLFEAVAQEFPNDVWFGCAYLRGRAIAGGCGFRRGDEYEMTWASSLREFNATAPNMLLYWSFMERCVAEGVARFNFGRCTPDSGTHRFKRQWGARDVPLWWYQHGRGSVNGTPSPKAGPYAWGPRVWQKLPLALANRLGPAIVRYLP